VSVSATTRKAGPFTGNGITTAFPFTFKVFSETEVLVVLTDNSLSTPVEYTQVLATDYTVALNANQDTTPGGTVNMVVAPATGNLLTVGSQVPLSQATVLINNGGFYPTVINDALDKITILMQQLSETVSRAVTLPFSSSASGDLPPVSPGSLIGWKADGSGLDNVGASGVGAGSIVPSNMAAGATGEALSTDTQAATTKATPVDADLLPIFDSAAAFNLKKLTWTNIKTTLFSTITLPFLQNFAGKVWDGAPVGGARLRTWVAATAATTGNIELGTSYNCDLNPSTGVWAGRDAADICWLEKWSDTGGVKEFWYAPTASVGVVPTWQKVVALDMVKGSAYLNAIVPAAYSNLKADAIGVNNYNCVITADKVVLKDSAGMYYGAESVNLTVNANGTVGNPLSIMSARAASTWYYRWVWYNTTAGLTATLDVSSTAPTAPSGYASTDFKALLPGACLTDASGSTYLMQTSTRGKRTQYVVLTGSNTAALPIMASGIAGSTAVPTWVSVALATFIPTSTASRVVGTLNQVSTSNQAMVAPNNSYGAFNSTTNPPPVSVSTSSGNNGGNVQLDFVVESANVYWASSATGGILQCVGWEDN